MSLFDIYDDILKEIFKFCSPIELYSLKLTSKRFYFLIKKIHPTYLFYNRIDFITQISNINLMKYHLNILKPFDEHFIIQLGRYLDKYPGNLVPFSWNLENLYTRKNCTKRTGKISGAKEGTLRLTILPDISIIFNTLTLLNLLEKRYGDHIIKSCILTLSKYLSRTTKPYDKQAAAIDDHDDFFGNPEEFFWAPAAYKYERWFKKRYPKITKCLRSISDKMIFA